MKSIIVIGAVVCLAACNGWAGENQDEWNRLMTEGSAQEKVGHYAAAGASYHAAARIVDSPTPDVRLALALNSWARAEDELGRCSDAEGLYRRALDVLKAAGDVETPHYAVILGNLGSLLVETGEIAPGLAMLQEALTMIQRLVPADDVKIAALCNGLAEALLKAGKYKEAERRLSEASVILEKQSRQGTELAITLSNLAVIRQEHGRHQEAERLLERSVELMEREVGTDHPLLVCGLNNLATVYSRTHRRDKAAAAFQRALALAEKHLGANHPTFGSVLLNYSAFLRTNGRKTEAKEFEAQSRDILRDSERRNGIGMKVDASTLRAK